MPTEEPRYRAIDARIDAGTPTVPHAASTDAGGTRARTVSFESQGIACTGDLYLPTRGEPPWPAVVMGHVFGAERAWGLARFAERFASAGIVAFPFDYRYFGGSEGTPRRLIDPGRQLDDWAAAVEHVRSLDEVDADRVAAWGSSFSGGHALATAHRDPDVAAVVAQVPFVDGRATVAHQTRDRSSVSRTSTLTRALLDRLLGVASLGSVEVPIVSEPGGGGLVDSPGAKADFLALVPDEAAPVNRTPARVVLDLPSYRPGREAGRIEAPVHVVIAEADRLHPHEPTERLVEALPDPSVHRVPATHLGVHVDPCFQPVVEAQVTFLTGALATAG